MLIKGTKKYNRSRNEGLPEHTEFGCMINGQGRGAVSAYRYGICRMSFNGCEVIAVHNALVYLKTPQKLSDIAFYMERFRMLFGFFGCNPYRIGKALEHFGARTERLKNAENASAFIIVFWTKIPFLSSVHTVFCIRRKCGIDAYNAFNSSSGAVTYKNIEELIGKRKPIAAYEIKENQNKEENNKCRNCSEQTVQEG